MEKLRNQIVWNIEYAPPPVPNPRYENVTLQANLNLNPSQSLVII